VEAYSPLSKAIALKDVHLTAIAKQYGKTLAQIMPRYLLQRDLVILPKSVHPERMEENLNVFGFTLSSGTMTELLGMDEGMTTGWDPTVGP